MRLYRDLFRLENIRRYSFELTLIKEIIEILVRYPYILKIEGHLGLREGAFLFRCASRISENGVAVEIGSFKGRSTMFIATGLKKIPGSKLFAIDTFEGSEMPDWARGDSKDIFSEFLKNTEKLKDVIVPIKGRFQDVVKNWDKEIDFLWIDGDHSYEGCYTDIINWVPFVKIGGIVAFHDYPNASGVNKAVNEIFKRKFEGSENGRVCLIYWAKKGNQK